MTGMHPLMCTKHQLTTFLGQGLHVIERVYEVKRVRRRIHRKHNLVIHWLADQELVIAQSLLDMSLGLQKGCHIVYQRIFNSPHLRGAWRIKDKLVSLWRNASVGMVMARMVVQGMDIEWPSLQYCWTISVIVVPSGMSTYWSSRCH